MRKRSKLDECVDGVDDGDLVERSRDMKRYAHSLSHRGQEEWQLLEDHLNGVAERASKFAEPFKGRSMAYLAGIWHDLGKYSKEFQNYLLRENGHEAHIEDVPGRVDHSTAGAKHAVCEFKTMGHLLGYCIAGHHSGLLDAVSVGACQEARLKKQIPGLIDIPDEIRSKPEPDLPVYLKAALGNRDAFAVAFFTRMLFSCLVDADFLDTGTFMKPDQSVLRRPLPVDILSRMERALCEYMDTLKTNKAPVNADRDAVRAACLDKAALPPGFFSLTVPTGGGKTLASLSFALRHALSRGENDEHQRIVYVIPFTSIIEQNAEVFREVMKRVEGIPTERLIIEHHSNFDPAKEMPESRLACENWEAPLIVTTSVQFYESLFANRTSACRKLHNLSRAVIILDEAQTLPVEYLKPCLAALKELVANYGATVVLCTATQPAVHHRADFPIGIEHVREIIPDPHRLYQRLKRVVVQDLGAQTDMEIAAKLTGEDQVLCVVNTRGHALKLWNEIGQHDGRYHLSTMMCPEHRTQKLNEIRNCLDDKKPCRVVSTQLIEAGVDVDFPVVFRSMAGLDSIVQAAGRCNRNGRISAHSRVYIFRSENPLAEKFLAETTNAGAQVLDLFKDDPLALEAIERYFKLYYWDQASRWDEYKIGGMFHLDGANPSLPFLFNFASAAKEFRLIRSNTRPVFVPWGIEGESLREELRKLPCLNRDIARRMQRYTVQIRERIWYENLNRNIEPFFDGSFAMLISPQMHYSDDYGLHLDEPKGDAQFG